MFYKAVGELWAKFCSETVPKNQIVFSELKIQLFDSISMLRNDYLKNAGDMFDGILDKVYMKLSKKTTDFSSGEIAIKTSNILKDAKNNCKKISQIFTTLSDDKSAISDLFTSFSQSLNKFLEKVGELIVEVNFLSSNFLKDFQYNHYIWLVINTIRKMTIGLKKKEVDDSKLTN